MLVKVSETSNMPKEPFFSKCSFYENFSCRKIGLKILGKVSKTCLRTFFSKFCLAQLLFIKNWIKIKNSQASEKYFFYAFILSLATI